MNTLSKVLAVFCVILSAVAFASWSPELSSTVSTDGRSQFDTPVSVATSADGKTVYVGKHGKVFKSSDGGETWFILK
jgi:photosystem II stability/assembly factor-like uncharacterized protein